MIHVVDANIERPSFLTALRSRLTPTDAALGRVVRGAIRPLSHVCTPVRAEGLVNLPQSGIGRKVWWPG